MVTSRASRGLRGFLLSLGVLMLVPWCRGAELDLTGARVIADPNLRGPAARAVSLLVDEVNRRTRISWHAVPPSPSPEAPLVLLGTVKSLPALGNTFGLRLEPGETFGAEGYRIGTDRLGSRPVVWVAGNDDRGVLFGAGRLVRELWMGRERVTLPAEVFLQSAPRTRLRGVQLGYRPKTNSYDAWDLPQWEQYYRDLILFGCNAVELIPPRSDDEPDSPHFPRPPLEMMVEMSRLADAYGLDVWIWYPAMDSDYSDPRVVAAALKEWDGVFRALPRVDAVFVPGGDPGHAPARVLMSFLERQAANLKTSHPEATLWISPQGFTKSEMDVFLSIVRQEPTWLGGLVHGPQVRMDVAELRAAVPDRFPIRDYPDITHTRHCQYPVPDWDVAFALAEGREVSNPRPLATAAIARRSLPSTIGGIVYSEGCHDDLNKVVWLASNWGEPGDVREVVLQYARLIAGADLAPELAEGLLALETSWEGRAIDNPGIGPNLERFRDLEDRGSPRLRRDWRFLQADYRAHADALVQARLRHDATLYASALQALRKAPAVGSQRAIAQADALLRTIDQPPVSSGLRERVSELAEALFQSIGAQLSVARYNAIALERGASMDTLNVPLTDAPWLRAQLAPLTRLDEESERLAGLEALLHREDPGPGGFYDDLGDPTRQPHLVPGAGWGADPASYRSPFVGFAYRGRGAEGKVPRAWWHQAETLYDHPLELRYENLDPTVRYRLRAVYARERPGASIRLDAEGYEVHGPLEKPFEPVEFPLPRQATADGTLTLTWRGVPGRGGSGRGCQVAEVWLLRDAAAK